MLIPAFIRSVAQLADPKVLKVLLKSILVAIGIFVAATFLASWLTSLIPDTGTNWLDEVLTPLINLGTPLAMALAGYFLFPALVTMALGFYLDEIVDAVEARYYPARPASRQVGTMEDVWIGLRLLFWIVCITLPVSLLLLLVGFLAPLAPFVYLGLNAYFLGREYFELVAIRHIQRGQVDARRKERQLLVWLAGLILAGLFFVPVVNLLAPVLGAALFTHIVQRRALPPLRG